MKTWVRSWHTPRLSAKASAAVVAAWVGSVSKAISSLTRASRACRSPSGSAPPPAATSRANAAIAASGAVSGVVAQEQAGREMLDRAAHDAVAVLGLDLALDQQPQGLERAVGAERVGDVAERVLLRVEPAVGRGVDAPVDHVLAVVIARRHAQRLDHALGRLVVAVDGFVRDSDAHATIMSRRRVGKAHAGRVRNRTRLRTGA